VSTNTSPGSAGGPEYLGPAAADSTSERTGGPGKKLGLLAGVSVAVVAVVGVGGWGAFTLLSGGGSQPAEAIPASAVGYLSLDLDPSASQKIEAIQILKKFPGIEKELDFGDRDDLRRYFFEKIQDEGECANLDYGGDIEPWIGDRVAMAAVPDDKDAIAPLVALQVSDQDAATTGLKALAECGEAGDEFGFAFVGDYVLMTEGMKVASSFADEAEQGSLADDDQFQERMDAAGDAGIVTMYASAEAPDYLLDLPGGDFFGPGSVSAMGPPNAEAMLASPAGSEIQDESDRMNDTMKELYKDFEGVAGVVRFEDGAVEVEFASKGAPTGMPGTEDGSETGVTTLPASTGAAASVALPDAWLEKYLEQLSAMMGNDMDLEDGLAEMEADTGLAVPEDIEALLGDSVALAVDSDIDVEALMQSEDPSQLPAGVKVNGDPDEILSVVDTLTTRFGPEADILVVESSEDAVAFGFDQDYVDALLAEGELGDEESFQKVIPNAEEASAVFYLNFDAGDGWADELAESAGEGDPEVVENVKPLDALGLSTWSDDDVQHGLLRMTTD
jgi:hypothetical protein